MAGNIYAKVGAAIRSRRDELGITQSALGERTGLGRTSITNMEKGGQSIFLHQLLDVARALKADPRDFLVDLDVEQPASVSPSDSMVELLSRLAPPARAGRR